MKDTLLKEMTSRGYWRINFQPLVIVEKLKSMAECRDAVEKNSVRLRGWSYPIFPQGVSVSSGLEPAGNYYLGWVDWKNNKEFWHMYKSGQFLHYLALREDWLDDCDWDKEVAKTIKPMSSLNIISSVTYQLTEVFEFLSRLANAGLYSEGVNVSISLNNTKNRKLWINDQGRVPFLQEYKTAAEKIPFVKKYTNEQIISSPKDNALEVIKNIFTEYFEWNNLPIETIKRDQENLLTRRF